MENIFTRNMDQIRQLIIHELTLYDLNCRLKMGTMIWIVLAGLTIAFPQIATGQG